MNNDLQTLLGHYLSGHVAWLCQILFREKVKIWEARERLEQRQVTPETKGRARRLLALAPPGDAFAVVNSWLIFLFWLKHTIFINFPTVSASVLSAPVSFAKFHLFPDTSLNYS